MFGSGARTGVAVLIAAKRSAAEGTRVSYFGVADYTSAEQKLSNIAAASLALSRFVGVGGVLTG